MDVETKTEKDVIDLIKVNKAFLIRSNIVEKKLPYKFGYFDEWMLKESKLLLNEARDMEFNLNNNENKVEKRYRVYKRGTIIKVDFGVNLGSEMSQIHLAIVLNNFDNPKNNTLTVVPLTSQYSPLNLDLEDLVVDKLLNQLDIYISGASEKLNENPECKVPIKKYHLLIKHYKTMMKNTYACCNLITTISKTRILSPINEYDIIGKARCSSEVLDKIEKEIKSKICKR